MNGNCGKSSGACPGPIPRAGWKGWGVGFQFIFRAFFAISLPPCCFFVSYSFLLCCSLCSQTQLCHLRLIGGKKNGSLEEVLTNRASVGQASCRKGQLGDQRV